MSNASSRENTLRTLSYIESAVSNQTVSGSNFPRQNRLRKSPLQKSQFSNGQQSGAGRQRQSTASRLGACAARPVGRTLPNPSTFRCTRRATEVRLEKFHGETGVASAVARPEVTC